MPKKFTVNYECWSGVSVKFLLSMKQKNNAGRGRQRTTGSETQHVWWKKKDDWQRIMGAYGTGWEEQQESRLTGGTGGLLPRSLSQQWGETQSWRVNIHRRDNYIFISVLDNPLISVQGRKWRGPRERRVEVLPCHRPGTSLSLLLLAMDAPSGHCEAVSMETWVRALMC